jgi:hypothetical protein
MVPDLHPDWNVREMIARTKPTSNPLLRHIAPMVVGVGLALAAGSVPASAQTIYDVDIAGNLRGVPDPVRLQVRQITRDSRKQMIAVLQKYGIDPNDPTPSMDLLMKASKDLQAVSKAQRDAVQKLLKPEEMAQYDTMVSATTQRIRQAAK